MILARAAGVEAEHRQILHVLRVTRRRSAVEHEDALGAVGAAEPEMFGESCTESAAANDDEVERSQVAASGQTGSSAGIRVDGDKRFVIGVAEITSGVTRVNVVDSVVSGMVMACSGLFLLDWLNVN